MVVPTKKPAKRLDVNDFMSNFFDIYLRHCDDLNCLKLHRGGRRGWENNKTARIKRMRWLLDTYDLPSVMELEDVAMIVYLLFVEDVAKEFAAAHPQCDKHSQEWWDDDEWETYRFAFRVHLYDRLSEPGALKQYWKHLFGEGEDDDYIFCDE